MRALGSLLTLTLLAAALLLLATPLRVRSADEDIAVIAHPSVPTDRIGAIALEALFTFTTTSWTNGDRVVPLNLEPYSATRASFNHAVLRMDPDHVARFWLDRRIRGQGASPRVAPNAELVRKVVSKLRGSIGYVPASMTGPDVKIVARIRNGEVVAP